MSCVFSASSGAGLFLDGDDERVQALFAGRLQHEKGKMPVARNDGEAISGLD